MRPYWEMTEAEAVEREIARWGWAPAPKLCLIGAMSRGLETGRDPRPVHEWPMIQRRLDELTDPTFALKAEIASLRSQLAALAA